MNQLEIQGLSAVRGGRTLFAGLSCAVDRGALLVLRGPNGSGKSTLLRLIAGLRRPDSGQILCDGAPIEDDPDAHRRRVAYVGHLSAVKAALRVRGNLDLWSGDSGAIGESLERFGLAHLADVPARHLSAGQTRRLALARLLLDRAPLWLLDEPTVALDANALGVLEGVLAQHCDGGGVAIVATHELGERAGAQTLRMEDFAPAAPTREPVDLDEAW
ncbi:MAG: heme ABC exporter ATP-binding protein CcmA [Alphaproteobacteria bacterium]|nr:heme ABC exporter ATP-binding protein CcmA [Alphaproteobacteria bacterium]